MEMIRLAVVIPNRVKCAPNDIAISQVLRLREIGYKVDLISLRKKGGDYEYDVLAIHHLWSQSGAIAFFRANTYIFHMFLPAMLAFFVRRSLCYVHSDIGPDCVDQFGLVKGTFVKYIWQLALLKSKKVAVVSSYLQKNLKIIGCSCEKKLVLVPTTSQHPVLYNLSAENKVPDITKLVNDFRTKHEKIFLVVGSFRDLKNQQLVIDLIAAAKDHRISIGVIFFGDGERLSDVMKKSVFANVSHQCLFLGHVNFPYLYSKEGDFLLSTSLSEGFPLSFVEARDNKIPVFALDIANLVESPSFVRLFRDEDHFIKMIMDKKQFNFRPEFSLQDACKILAAALED